MPPLLVIPRMMVKILPRFLSFSVFLVFLGFLALFSCKLALDGLDSRPYNNLA